jgi:hypothetical protein
LKLQSPRAHAPGRLPCVFAGSPAVAWDCRKGRAVDAQEQRQFAALVQAVLALQEAERKWGPDDLTVLQAKERLFEMANNFILVQETDVEPARERDAMRAREAERQRQKQREQDRDPDQLRQLEPQESRTLSMAERLWIVMKVVAERMEYAFVAAEEVVFYLRVLRVTVDVAEDVYQKRELIAAKVEKGREAASDLAGDLAHKARSVGLAVGEAAGGAVAQWADPIDVGIKVDESAERLAARHEAKAKREADLDLQASLRAVRSAQVDQVEQQRRPPQRDGGIEISGP